MYWRYNMYTSDLICFSDFFPTIVEAAGLPQKVIADGDGWSFWPQCVGKKGRQREWIYCYYFPRPSSPRYNTKYNHYEVQFARNARYKLYDDGQMFDTIEDVLEKKPLLLQFENSLIAALVHQNCVT